MDLKGRVALITGGGSGIGTGIARRFVKDGAKVCICGRREEMLKKVAASLPAGSVVICPGDVTKPADAEKMVKVTLDFAGKLDILVNDAGIDNPGDILEIDLEVWNQVIATNLTGPMLMIRNSIPAMLKAGGGSIINIASLAGVRCIPGMPAYCASKAGLIMLTKQVALDYSQFKIRSNVVCPGAVMSMLENPKVPMSEEMKANINQTMTKMAKYSPLKRVGTPAEIAAICSFLASDDSSFLTGTVLMADAGSSIVDVNAAEMVASGKKWTHEGLP
jgi:meso-butanediol dehydrogenase / (S,S)-butanediol dehydrogenase / diacetyl reductase